MVEKTVKTWEWLPRRSEAVLGLRLIALFVVGHLSASVLTWMYYIGESVFANTQARAGVLGIIEGVVKATWRMARANDLYSDRSAFLFVVVIAVAFCGYVALSKKGVPHWIVRRCPRD